MLPGPWPLLPYLLAAVSLPARAEECPSPTTTAGLQALAEKAEWAFGSADLDAFQGATRDLVLGLPCLVDEVPRPLAARLHRLSGLDRFVQGDRAGAAQAFAAARLAQPDYRFPESLVAAGNPLLGFYEAQDTARTDVLDLPRWSGGYFQLDGRTATERPTGWPVLFQALSESGQVLSTAYLWPMEALPAGAWDLSLIHI